MVYLTMLKGLLIIALSIQLASFANAAQGYKLRAHRPAPHTPPDHQVKTTTHVVRLTRRRTKRGLPQSSNVLASLHNAVHVNGVAYGVSTIIPTKFGQEYSTAIKFGTQWFEALLDTGSSDTWLASESFTCVNSNNITINRGKCNFGPLYDTSSKTFRLVENQNFNISYGSGEFLNGIIGREWVTLANITAYHQVVGIANVANWYGDGISSGLIGMAYPSLTSAFNGTNATEDVRADALIYRSLFPTLIKQGVTPIFAIALNRSPTFAGLLSIGGIPPGQYHPPSAFAHVPIQILEVLAWPQTAAAYSFYTIYIEEFVYPASSPPTTASHTEPSFNDAANKTTDANWSNIFHPRSSFSTRSTAPWDHAQYSQNYTSTPVFQPVIVDSGTNFNFVPYYIAATINALFDPPAHYDKRTGGFYVPCNATAPRVGVTIGTKTLWHAPQDLVVPLGFSNGVCGCGLQVGSTNFLVLGDVFLKNVLAVFDVGAAEMRFAQR